ncbi:hypothetical protein CH063_13020 [Colletotrichum higginsianum]|uniref:Uncharacterized protein n=1 Tax=Colletotrichum higginsianum (strain IMI 349063) TaxID=759273 RepID=H1VSQ3_COLHI|nr:hypothetical protein CH63R_09279 [Colletotrichum higginsianum IMI 349063]OBR07758.1 hypothetical protein CH63R_09279 [Colletotrichum higginsianum IMI 349063]CCF43261.1 hypothetical protein CH063_13020 [Colletotrichum higginsianum]
MFGIEKTPNHPCRSSHTHGSMPTCQMLGSISFFAILRAETSRSTMVHNGDGRCETDHNNPRRLQVAHPRWVGFGLSVCKPVSHLIPTSSDVINGCVSMSEIFSHFEWQQ